MLEFDLVKVPNQSFTTSIGDNSFDISLRTFRGIIYASVSINDEAACNGQKIIPNASIFPKSVNDVAGGVFLFACVGDEYPNYDKFNGTDVRFLFIPYGEE